LLSELDSLSPDAARELAKHRDFLGLNGLLELSPEVAAALAEHRGPLSLNGLEKIDAATARAIAGHAGKLYLNGLKVLDAAVAEPLVEAVISHLRERGAQVSTGIFGADMQVSLINDGPMTIQLEVTD
jgi:hypothetical protein